MALSFERLVSRGVVRFISEELDLSGVRMGVERFMRLGIFGFFLIFVGSSAFLNFYFKLNLGLAVVAGIGIGAFYIFALYATLEYYIEKRKNFVESVLPDYIQLTAANMRSGISLDKAMIASARPEFGYFTEDIILMDKQIYSGESMQGALIKLGARYRSRQLQHTVRMMAESIRYGGSMNDLLKQVAKDMRNQMIIQKEISGQLFLYTIFIAFAVLIGGPTLYALTAKMISVTDTVWAGILRSNPTGLPSAGVAFLKPTPPQITIAQYTDFSITAVVVITALGSIIISVISTGTMMRGLKYLPIYVIIGLLVFYAVSVFINGAFGGLGVAP